MMDYENRAKTPSHTKIFDSESDFPSPYFDSIEDERKNLERSFKPQHPKTLKQPVFGGSQEKKKYEMIQPKRIAVDLTNVSQAPSSMSSLSTIFKTDNKDKSFTNSSS